MSRDGHPFYKCRCERCQCKCFSQAESKVCWLCTGGHHRKQARKTMPEDRAVQRKRETEA